MNAAGKTAVVIGSGVGGLATAIRLANRGYAVKVFEAQPYVGGKMTKIEQDGFFWGFGPSLLTMPFLIDELFLHCGKNPADYYRYHRVDPICNYFYPDGTRLSSSSDAETFARELEEKLGEPRRNTLNYLRGIQQIYDLTKEVFLFRSLHRLSTYLRFSTLKSVLQLHRLKVWKTMHQANKEQFVTPKAVQLFNRYATYNGSDPYVAPATLNVIAHPEYNQGGYIMEGGMPALSAALYRLAQDMGVNFTFSSPVSRIVTEGKRATGVVVGETFRAADLVVTNMDVVYTYQQLLPQVSPPRRIMEDARSFSGLVFYFGVKKTFSALHVHNILFSADYPKEFAMLEKGEELTDDPTVYIFVSQKMNPGHAPEGCENWFIHINAPAHKGQDWSQIVPKMREIILHKISRHLGEDVRPLIVTETVNTPETIAQKTRSFTGSLYGASSNDRFAAFLRHPNFSREFDNLFFCGGTVHPGGGVPLCLLSAQIIDEQLLATAD